jgi:hypothetical protein
MTVVCADELGPVIPRSFPPAPGWTADGLRVKAPLDYGRGPEKTWVYGALRVADGQTVTLTAPARNSVGYQRLLAAIQAANPAGAIMVITDNLSSHHSLSTREWLVDHPRLQHTFIPTGACWGNLQEGWWRLFRRQALAGQCFATPVEITLATRVATCQLNARARPWVWGPAHHHRPVPCAASSPTESEEHSITGSLLATVAGKGAAADLRQASQAALAAAGAAGLATTTASSAAPRCMGSARPAPLEPPPARSSRLVRRRCPFGWTPARPTGRRPAAQTVPVGRGPTHLNKLPLAPRFMTKSRISSDTSRRGPDRYHPGLSLAVTR